MSGSATSTRRESRIDVLGVGISAVRMSDVCSRVRLWIERGERRYVCVTGVHGVIECQADPELKQIHNESGLTVPDGMPMVWSGWYAGAPEMDRVYGPEMMLEICRMAGREGWRSFFYGGAPGVAEKAAAALQARVPRLQVAGMYCPPFRPLTEDEDRAAVDRINASGAELVWVGLSTPKQERWMADHVDRFAAPIVLCGVGAAFDIHAGLRRVPPRWVGRIGLHWLFRLVQEPKRLWRRYLWANPRFLVEVVRRRPRLRQSEVGARADGYKQRGTG